MSSSTHVDTIGAAFTGPNVLIEDRHFVASPDDDDPLKFSKATNARIRGSCSVTGQADENGSDINNESSVIVEGTLRLECGDQSPQLVKGGSSLMTEGTGEVVIVAPAKARADLLVDDWSDQSQAPSTVGTKQRPASIRRDDHQPLRVVFGRWRRPKITGPSKVVWSWTIGLHLYNPLKALVRLILRIPTGTKGPSWL